MRWVGRRASGAVIVAVVLGMPGCDGASPSPEPRWTPPIQTAPARYSTVDGGCPTFDGPEAQRYHAAGLGTPSDPLLGEDVAGLALINCEWAPAEARPRLSVTVTFFLGGVVSSRTPVDNARDQYDSLRARAEERSKDDASDVVVSDRKVKSSLAFVAAYAAASSVICTVLVDNAVVAVDVEDREIVTDDLDALAQDLLGRVGPDAVALAGAAVDSLR